MIFQKSIKLLAGILLFLIGAAVLKATPIFSYYTDMDSSDGVTYNAIDIISIYHQEDEIARSESGWGYSIPKTARFATDSSMIISDTISMSYFGSHTISGEIWVRPYCGNGVLWTWGDTSALNYFRMMLNNDCSVLMERNLLDSTYTVISSNTLDTTYHHYIRWVSEIIGDTLYQTLRIDGQFNAEKKDYLQSGTGLVQIRSPFRLGGASNSNDSQSFRGEIHAVTLMNVLSKYELSAFIPFDGSRYSGIPYYWDCDHWKTYSISPTEVKTLIFVPYLHDNFVPQGLTNSFEDPNYSKSKGLLYISLYNKTISGLIGQKRSIIVEIDPQNNYKVRRCFRLRGQLQYSHNGGIAFRDNFISVAGSGYIESYQIPDYKDDDTLKYQDIFPKNLLDVEGSTSFTTFFNDTLWVGDFKEEGQANPYLRGYPLNSDGTISDFAPKYYRIPLLTQGCTWGRYGGQVYLFTSISSGGSNNSRLYRFKRSDLSATKVPEPNRVYEFPSGGEDISFDRDGDLWCVSESGARYYQLRASNPWEQFFPFIYEIEKSVIFGDIDTTLATQANNTLIPEKFNIFNYPNPFNGYTIIKYILNERSIISISVYNICGEEVATILQGESKEAGEYQVEWNEPNLSTGIYFVKMTDIDNHQSVTKMIYLK